MSGKNYKLVTWTNHNYLKEIQCGIQAAHSSKVIERVSSGMKSYKEWSENDTMVILQGGGHLRLKDIAFIIDQVSYAYSIFHQEELPNGIFYEPELNYSATAVSLIVSDESRNEWREKYDELGVTGVAIFEQLMSAASFIQAFRDTYHTKYPSENLEYYANFLVRFSYWMDSCKLV
ncbi:hypothetical protein [Stenotrophomonas phage RAS14]